VEAEARVRQNRADYYPNLFLETDASRYKGSFSGNSQNSNASDSNLYSYYLGLSQNIYDFGRRESKVQSSWEDLKAFEWDLKDVRLLVMDDIRQGYYGVLLADRIVKVREEDLERTGRLRQAQV
jgi:outer membrane protein TolC